MIRNTSLLLILFASLTILAVALVYTNTLRGELVALQEAGEVRLNEAASRLRLQIDGFREQANFLASSSEVETAVVLGNGTEIQDNLINFALTYGAWRVDLVGSDGQRIASSGKADQVPIPSDALLQAALNERLGFELAIEEGRRVIRLSRGVGPENLGNLGALILTIDVAELEFQWPFTPEPLVFFDEELISFSSNRPELLLLSLGGDPEEQALDLRPNGKAAGFDTWTFAPPNVAASNALVLSRPVPHLLLNGQIILDIAPAQSAAFSQALLALTLATVLGLVAAIAVLQRRRFDLEAQHSATLEARVEDRTAELRAAQDELVAASKLAALGRLSAGVSHELNQPLAAILNFSENARKFLSRGASSEVEDNLGQISSQITRITRIISNLRAFARQEATPSEKVNLTEILQSALDLTEEELRKAGIETKVDIPEHALPVLAGRVRLEQVFLNLLNNAIDAMQTSEEKRLNINLSRAGDNAVLTIQDSGCGISDPDRVFEPFYSTKDLGASKGLGMGLALSFGIITRFGGALSCKNTDPGAEFKIQLPILERHVLERNDA